MLLCQVTKSLRTSLVTIECVSFSLDGVCVTAWYACHHKNVDYMIMNVKIIYTKKELKTTGSVVLGTGEYECPVQNVQTCRLHVPTASYSPHTHAW